jgi:hypothetical protein
LPPVPGELANFVLPMMYIGRMKVKKDSQFIATRRLPQHLDFHFYSTSTLTMTMSIMD